MVEFGLLAMVNVGQGPNPIRGASSCIRIHAPKCGDVVRADDDSIFFYLYIHPNLVLQFSAVSAVSVSQFSAVYLVFTVFIVLFSMSIQYI